MADLEARLAGTPYLIGIDAVSMARFEAAAAKSLETRDRVVRANQRIKAEAQAVFGPYLDATRMDLVAQSNEIEGMDWTQDQVREIVRTNQELIDAPVRMFVESVRSDPRVYEVLGLYRAHAIAETWSTTDRVPRTHEIRELHKLILGAIRGSGEYKRYANAIGGTRHRTAPPEDVPRVMLELADWWEQGTGDPLLTATVAHAWLAHIHPFEDGNGRLARILANLELSRHEYPPLVVRAGSDRGEYYAALASSDDGDLLPLYELFGRALRRQAQIMGKPDYVLELIEDRLLASESQRHGMWATTLGMFTDELSRSLAARGAELEVQGTLDPASFGLLCERDVDGNGWFAKIRAAHHQSEWLLWFGFRSNEWIQIAGSEHIYPSIFISRRDRSSLATHPFTQGFERVGALCNLPDEISIIPAVSSPVELRSRFDITALRPDAAAADLAGPLAAAL